MNTRDITKLANYGKNSYDKETFHRLGRAYLKMIAQVMGLVAGTFEIRSCKGGPGVMGEVILHTETVYIHLSGESNGEFYYRSCKGRKDYTGGRNRWLEYAKLENPYEVAALFKAAAKDQT